MPAEVDLLRVMVRYLNSPGGRRATQDHDICGACQVNRSLTAQTFEPHWNGIAEISVWNPAQRCNRTHRLRLVPCTPASCALQIRYRHAHLPHVDPGTLKRLPLICARLQGIGRHASTAITTASGLCRRTTSDNCAKPIFPGALATKVLCMLIGTRQRQSGHASSSCRYTR